MSGELMLRGAIVGALAVAAGLVVAAIGSASGEPAAAWAIEAAVILVAGALAGYFAFRESSRAVHQLTQAAERVAAGDFEQRVPIASGPAGELTRGFNTMTRRLQELLATVAAERARLEAVFDASADAMVALGRDNTVRFLNAAACRLFETTPAATLNRPFIETARDYELDALVRRAVAQPGTGETAVVTFGPSRLPLRAAARPILGGGDWAVLLMLTDLTEFNRVDQVRRDFLSNVSHELRTPLASVRALAETIESGAVEPGPDTQEFAARILQQADRLTALVNELLDLSRIESGAVELHPEPVDLAALAAEAAGLLRARTEQAGITVDVPEPPGATAEADRGALLRVVTNLLDNAIKYSPAGSHIRVATEEQGDLASLSVTDEGPGIPLAERDRVFERFYKGDQSRAGAGVGLGLAIVKHLVRAHGGRVAVTGSDGRGATFTVSLPRQFIGHGPAGRR